MCGGDDSTCAGCDGVPHSGKVNDACGICGGNGSLCAVPLSPPPPPPDDAPLNWLVLGPTLGGSVLLMAVCTLLLHARCTRLPLKYRTGGGGGSKRVVPYDERSSEGDAFDRYAQEYLDDSVRGAVEQEYARLEGVLRAARRAEADSTALAVSVRASTIAKQRAGEEEEEARLRRPRAEAEASAAAAARARRERYEQTVERRGRLLAVALRELFIRAQLDVHSAFAFFDTSGDGVISPDEFTQGLERLNIELSGPRLDSILRLVDTDHDGNINLREFFAKFFSGKPPRPFAAAAAAAFSA